jgi:2-hydroxy-6-oxonona-2,4-dienedioate hydrolase
MALTEEGLIDVPDLYSRFVRLPSGVKVHYVTSGKTGPNVVLLHGGITGSSGTAGWRFMAPYLGKNGFRVYCPDMPYFGLTEDPNSFYVEGPKGHIDFVHDFTTALCLETFHLGGNSMGTDNSVLYALAHPERVISMGLVATRNMGIDLLDNDALTEAGKNAKYSRPFAGYNFDGTEDSMRTMMEGVIYRPDGITDDLIKMRTQAANRHLDAKGYYASLPTGNDKVRFSVRGKLDKLTIPTIYLYGMNDNLGPVEGGYLQEDLLPNFQFFYPDECGHQGQTDQPEMFNEVFLEFFRDGIVSRKSADWAGVSSRRPELVRIVSED